MLEGIVKLTFNHVTIPKIEDLQSRVKAKTTKSKRVYTVDGSDKAYPSITTILGSLSKKAIMEWRKRVGAEEANRISRQASTKGTRVHSLIEDFINNKQVELKDEPLHITTAVKGIQSALKENVTDIYAQECVLYSNYLRVAGRVDCIGVFADKLSVIDFKTSRRHKEKKDISSYFMQEAAYAIMFEERTGIPITQLVTIMAVDGQVQPLVFIEQRDNWTKQLMKTVYNYHINN
jgi:genome maintenance exonuclease 1